MLGFCVASSMCVKRASNEFQMCFTCAIDVLKDPSGQRHLNFSIGFCNGFEPQLARRILSGSQDPSGQRNFNFLTGFAMVLNSSWTPACHRSSQELSVPRSVHFLIGFCDGFEPQLAPRIPHVQPRALRAKKCSFC